MDSRSASESDEDAITAVSGKRNREGVRVNPQASGKKQVRIADEGEEEQDEQEDEEEDVDEGAEGKRRKKKKLNKNLQGVNGGYAWEDEIQRSWDLVKVDNEGNMAALVASIIEARKKRSANKDITPYQRGIIRTMILVIDCSEAMLERDLRPNRHAMTVQYAIDFVHNFFDQNPISQLCIVAMRNGMAQLVSQVSGNPQEHIEALKAVRKQEPKGNPSLQNALEMARGLLLHVPSHCTREVLIVFGALSSTDPGDIHQTIASLANEHIRTRVIGLSAQVAICKELCKQTNYGDNSYYGVILNETHFKDLFAEAVVPLPVNKMNKGFTLVKMGFPTRIFEDTPSFCTCHSRLVHGGYFCPNCKSKVCSLPIVCPCCDLMLILSTHLARSYHHLMPLKVFQELPVDIQFPTENCFSCQKKFPRLRNYKTQDLLTSSRYRCENCKCDFCIDCDVFVHEILHNCPGCESKAVL
ncbi:ADR338Cp [Eremothecium gossypii ATCC 10895]|uniref:General transcription and DNA repair factor IIH n=1 Tax=Eremothecium gossypii (strain ATCC 10895 / CBS 109.51 / FGSC 9923 / NRRL Y-1056) TaxID=284811 RepID=Q759D9_EREGS|nr:ADR338Cp [Eremothecium gossypii ATCC 10895]AAS52258.1 ADR338Cp [Eremothecium gossypii ATCC 10895]AEY96557.1 FADR338Cp [Eremothecium gossypii FDAG1]